MTFQIDKFYVDTVVGKEEEKKYVSDKNKIKEMNDFMEMMKKEKMLAMSDAEINHEKNESHKVDINIPNFTIHIGGKTLLEDANLKITFGKKICSYRKKWCRENYFIESHSKKRNRWNT